MLSLIEQPDGTLTRSVEQDDNMALAKTKPPSWFNNEWRRINESNYQNLQRGKALGDALIAKKAELGHGNWIPWVREHLEFSEDSASIYMTLAEKWDIIANSEAIRNLPATVAVKQIKKQERLAKQANQPAKSENPILEAELVETPALPEGKPNESSTDNSSPETSSEVVPSQQVEEIESLRQRIAELEAKVNELEIVIEAQTKENNELARKRAALKEENEYLRKTNEGLRQYNEQLLNTKQPANDSELAARNEELLEEIAQLKQQLASTGTTTETAVDDDTDVVVEPPEDEAQQAQVDANTRLNRRQLAKRLGKSEGGIRQQERDYPGNFDTWSRERDPDNIAWENVGKTDKTGKQVMYAPKI
jgi:archaellum component FlaC